ncbi:DUF3710 domain-containing protein [Serinibacter salmoneus]|uniref:Uncharacterized protein DUF3710 n=1 Tax=Serinibacter salmoneus TaxID=556530 RepID=A0A2A9CYN5_9MICO|nr:DUF3710 domain-containing protein [Serinibacter salmoneus]PFG19547.1 uncharacterized protein DUF3710 [Serinibacter salmoneus]
MALFGRNRSRAEQAPEPSAAELEAVAQARAAREAREGTGGESGEAPQGQEDAGAVASQERSAGPWDVSEAPDRPGLVDLGALRIPGRAGMALRMELDRRTRRVVAANVTIGQSNLQLQAFSAPRTAGIWDDIRTQLAASIGKQGGSVKQGNGRFGPELLVLLPVKDAEGKPARRPARFLGVDGDRWFLRGVLTGAALVDKAAMLQMEEYFSEVVVARGDEPRPPAELLTLTMPTKSGAAGDAAAVPSAQPTDPTPPTVAEPGADA